MSVKLKDWKGKKSLGLDFYMKAAAVLKRKPITEYAVNYLKRIGLLPRQPATQYIRCPMCGKMANPQVIALAGQHQLVMKQAVRGPRGLMWDSMPYTRDVLEVIKECLRKIAAQLQLDPNNFIPGIEVVKIPGRETGKVSGSALMRIRPKNMRGEKWQEKIKPLKVANL
jgi:hypothetical protein